MLTVSELYERHHPGQLKFKANGTRGEEKSGPCPGCHGDDRFTVFTKQNGGSGSYSCRICGKSGDVVQFFRDFEGMSYREACKAADKVMPPRRSCPVAPKTEESKRQLKAAESVPPLQEWQDKATAFTEWAFEQLMGGAADAADQREYLASRGLPVGALAQFRIGYNPGDGKRPCIMRPRKVWGLPDGEPREKGGKPRRALWLPRGLVIPLRQGGKALRLRIRRPDTDREGALPDLKYYVVPGSEMSAMWLPQSGENGCGNGSTLLPLGTVAVVVESELDALMLAYHAGSVCSVLGIMTAQIRNLPGEVLRRLQQCAVILVATDVGDKSEAGKKGWEIWRETFPQARRWPCVGGKDPGEMYAAGRNVLHWVLAGLPKIIGRAALQRLEDTHPHGQPQGQPQRQEGAEKSRLGPAHPEDEPLEGMLHARHVEMVDAEGRPIPRGDCVRALREMTPLTRTYYGDMRIILRVLCLHGLCLHGDGHITGHENWDLLRLGQLVEFCRRHSRMLDKLQGTLAGECTSATQAEVEA